MIAKLADDTFLQSNAMNFMSFLAHGVDPRTGQYSMRLELPPVRANDLRDIDFPLVLQFNSMQNEDTGYGHNWKLQLTHFTPSNSMLTLATGETFKVDGEDSITKQLTMSEKKLDTFHLYRHGSNGYRIVHRSGLVEVLEFRGSGSNRAAVPVQVASPLGHVLRLDYEAVGGGFARLKTIFQGDGEPVFGTLLEGNTLSLTYFPEAAGGPGASYKMHMTGPLNSVSRIELPTHDKGAWDFTYTNVHGLWCIEGVTTPNNGKELLLYTNMGHLLPGKQNVQIPRVTWHTVTPGLDQPEIKNQYTYPDDSHNFLGYGLAIDWTRDGEAGLDALYQHVGDYSYGSVETLFKDDVPLRSIERRFNQFHLQTLEKTTQGGNIVQTATAYESILKEKPFAEQPRTFQLPTKTSRLWWHEGQSPLRGAEIETTSYDGYGNVLVKTKANKVVETNAWYPATESAGHPVDKEGFVRNLREKTITPASKGAAKLVQRHTYTTRDALANDGFPDLQPCHIVDSDTLVAIDDKGRETELEKVQYSYTDDPTDPFQHGRLSMHTTLRDAKLSMSTFDYTRLEQSPFVQTTETTMGLWDGQMATQVRKESIRTGLLHEEQDADGVITRFEYDLLGRITLESVASKNNEFAAERKYAYHLRGASVDAEALGQILTDALGVSMRTFVDGLGRPVRVAKDNINSEVPKRLHDTHTLTYDELGNKASETAHDWYLDIQTSRHTRYQYDNWNQLTRTISPEGVSQHEEKNPVGTVEYRDGPVIRRWTSGSDGKVSSRVEVWMNLFEKPVSTRRMDSAWKLLPGQEHVQVYDGLGRCIEDIDERQYSTHYTYDARDRVTSTQYPDSTLIERAYASHSAEELPVSLTVTPQGNVAKRKEIASQQYDSLERLVSRTVGERTETYLFTGGYSQPDSYTTAAGDTISYEYDLALSLLPKKSSIVGDDFEFDYDPVTGSLREALTTRKDEGGKRTYVYDKTGRQIAETWTGPDGKPWETSWAASSTGLPHRQTRANEVETLYQYDKHLRLASSVQGLVTVGYQYDTLGRVEMITTQNTANGGATQVTSIEYDDYGRESKRVETVTGQPMRVVNQRWGKDELLDERIVRQGGKVLLREAFTYDSRQRLTGHECSGSELPKDPFGQPYTQLTLTLDGYDNVTSTTYELKDDPELQRAIYSYRTADPCQLESISYIPAKTTLTFSYDKNGHLQHDERGFVPAHDSRGRMTAVKDKDGTTVATYRYDAHSQLYASQVNDQEEQLLFFEENRLSIAVRGAQTTQLVYAADQPVAQHTPGVARDTVLLQTNASGSVLAELRDGKLSTFSYAAYGDCTPANEGLLGYNGELREATTGWYLLGRGYRAFNPVLMRFHSPDALSPFDGGGLNPYAYCNANPVTFRDPTGHAAEGWSGSRLPRPQEDDPFFFGGRKSSSSSTAMWTHLGLSAAFLVLGALSFGSALAAASAAGATVGAVIVAISAGAALVAETVALGLNIAGYAKGDPGLLEAGQIATYTGLAVGAPAALVQGYKMLRAIPQFFKNSAGAARGSMSSMGSASRVERMFAKVGNARVALPRATPPGLPLATPPGLPAVAEGTVAPAASAVTRTVPRNPLAMPGVSYLDNRSAINFHQLSTLETNSRNIIRYPLANT